MQYCRRLCHFLRYCESEENTFMLNKLERALGKYAIPNLMRYLIGGYVLGYFLMLGSRITSVNFLTYMTLEPYYIIHKFQIWRIFTWIMIPETSNILFFAIMLLLYYQLGTALENAWGTFRFNAYIIGGMLATLIGAFVLYFIYGAVTGSPVAGVGGYFSMQYINLSIFLAFAVCFPDMEVLLYFIIPIKMKWMAVVYAVMIAISLVGSSWSGRVAIICSLLNFLIFYLSSRNYRRVDPREIHRKQEALMSLYEEHVGGQLSKESFTEKRESLLRVQNEKKRQLAQLESDWELLSAEEETAKKEERQTSVLSPYHEISVLDPALMRELVCEISVFHRQKIQINWKFSDFSSEFIE